MQDLVKDSINEILSKRIAEVKDARSKVAHAKYLTEEKESLAKLFVSGCRNVFGILPRELATFSKEELAQLAVELRNKGNSSKEIACAWTRSLLSPFCGSFGLVAAIILYAGGGYFIAEKNLFTGIFAILLSITAFLGWVAGFVGGGSFEKLKERLFGHTQYYKLYDKLRREDNFHFEESLREGQEFYLGRW